MPNHPRAHHNASKNGFFFPPTPNILWFEQVQHTWSQGWIIDLLGCISIDDNHVVKKWNIDIMLKIHIWTFLVNNSPPLISFLFLSVIALSPSTQPGCLFTKSLSQCSFYTVLYSYGYGFSLTASPPDTCILGVIYLFKKTHTCTEIKLFCTGSIMLVLTCH